MSRVSSRTTFEGMQDMGKQSVGMAGWVSRHRMVGAVVAVGAVSGLVGCQWLRTPPPEGLGAERLEASRPPVAEAQLQAAAERVFAGIREAARADGSLDTDSDSSQRIRNIARRLIAVSGALRADAPDWKWEVLVLRSPSLDVWCLPGGKLIVHSSLISRPEMSDDEAAAVIAHEIAHAIREHARERAGMAEAWRALLPQSDPPVTADGPDRQSALAFQIMTQWPYGIPHETEADRLGVELAARAGFDPRAILSSLEKLAPGRHTTAPEWTLRHPSSRSRSRDLDAYATRVAPLQPPTTGR